MATASLGHNGLITADIGQQLARVMDSSQPELAKAYVAFWGQVSVVVKDAVNPHFKNNYATLDATLAAIRPALAANRLALLSVPGVVRDGNMVISTKLIHESGQSWTFTTEMPLGPKATAQAAGSCITYARRYVALAIAGIAPVDDDGEAASHQVSAPAPPDEGPADGTNVARLVALIAAIKPKKGGKLAAVTALESIKAEVARTGDDELVAAYVAKRTELKALNN